MNGGLWTSQSDRSRDDNKSIEMGTGPEVG
jgi:hypothetical protein